MMEKKKKKNKKKKKERKKERRRTKSKFSRSIFLTVRRSDGTLGLDFTQEY